MTDTEYTITAEADGERRIIRTTIEDTAQAIAAFWAERRGFSVTVTSKAV